ncbi:MAG TPA: hemerythrin domain-containing protein [Actinopolymorphaceae bacterium]|jgi:hypothetical protein
MADQSHVEAGNGEDVVSLLMRQHGEIRNLFDQVEASRGEERREAMRQLVRLLAVHETAEEEVVHPVARRAYDGAEQVVQQRLDEEHEAKQRLSDLEDMDPESDDFMPMLLALRTSVMQHARAEERYEFPHLRRTTSAERLRTMAKAVKTAESVAPTRPRPGVESARANIALGPVAALVDRARDVVRRTFGRGK